MTEAVQNDYQVSSEGAVRHWEIPYDRLADQTPTPTHPAEVTSLLNAVNLTGTILTIDATGVAATSIAVIDFTCSMVYRQSVRNVLTWNAGVAELTWGPIEIGDIVYYDDNALQTALGFPLSTSVLSSDAGVANTRFGWVVGWSDADIANYPKGDGTASTQTCAIMQIGAGG